MENDDDRSEFSRLIQLHIDSLKKYTFRPIKVDNIECYIVIYGDTKIVNFESIHIDCKIERSGEVITQPYSIYYFNYITLACALRKIEEIVNTYKIFDGDLVSPKQYRLLKMETKVIPYREEQSCCVCFKSTYDTTLGCNHYICLHCRNQCIINKKKDCPICRKENILKYYNNDIGLINNNEYPVVFRSINPPDYLTYESNEVVVLASTHESSSESTSSQSSSRSSSPPPLLESDEGRTSSPDPMDMNYHTPMALMYWRRLNDNE